MKLCGFEEEEAKEEPMVIDEQFQQPDAPDSTKKRKAPEGPGLPEEPPKKQRKLNDQTD
jgi:hypothetical protein